MKLIDEKGKLFGLVNIIDLIVIVVIVGILGAVVYKFGISNANSADADTPAVTNEVYLTVKSRSQPPGVADQIKEGDKLVAKGAFQNAEVVSVTETPSDYVSWTADGEGVLTTHPIWKDIVIVVKDKSAADAPIVKVGGQEARSGKEFIFKTNTVELISVAYDIEFK